MPRSRDIAELETLRLCARRIREDDLAELCRMHQNPQVMATLGGLRSDEETRQMLAAYIEQWETNGFGLWMWFYKTDGRFVGRGGLRPVVIEGRDEIEVAYALLPEFWNQGLATEIARASVSAAFNDLGISELVCFTLPTNLASQRVMEKAGFVFERDMVWKDLPHVFYRLKR
ncbi:MAG TPA: GNAT family N-acetyltransferase [Pirellulales bacterium]|nr:GNAT family N-acetyltransferase [Pirellulales bacterium]